MTSSKKPDRALNNPAGRLLRIIQEVQPKNPKDRARKIWAETLELDVTDTAALLTGLADVIYLVRDTRRAIERLDDVDRDLFLEPLPKLEKALAHANLQGNWSGYATHIDDQVVLGLRHAADKLSRMGSEKVVAEADLSSLAELVDEALDSVINSDLPQQAKAVFIERLEEVKRAVKRYRIWGIDGLEKSLHHAVGSAVVHREVVVSHSESEGMTNFFAVIGKLNQILAVATNAQELLGPFLDASKLLPPG